MQSAHIHTGLKTGAAQQEHQTLIAEPEVGKHTLMFLSSLSWKLAVRWSPYEIQHHTGAS
jgi:hypothetical protein